MAGVTLYHHAECERCIRIAKIHRRFDWLGRLSIATTTSPIGPLRPGQIVVHDQASGQVCQGVDAVRKICRQIPAYWLVLPVLYLPFVACRIDQSVRGCEDGECAIASAANSHTKVMS